MTAKDLTAFFKEHLVPSRLYAVNGSRKNRICMEQEGGSWIVYFRDHRNRIGTVICATEAEACARMKDEIRKVMESAYGLTWSQAAV